MSSEENSEKKSFLFKRLVLTFHTATMQQMGKITDPMTGKISRDLDQASISIDTLDMLLEYCSGSLSEENSRFLEHLLSELKLNFVDEIGRPDPKPEETENEDTDAKESNDAATEQPEQNQESHPADN